MVSAQSAHASPAGRQGVRVGKAVGVTAMPPSVRSPPHTFTSHWRDQLPVWLIIVSGPLRTTHLPRTSGLMNGLVRVVERLGTVGLRRAERIGTSRPARSAVATGQTPERRYRTRRSLKVGHAAPWPALSSAEALRPAQPRPHTKAAPRLPRGPEVGRPAIRYPPRPPHHPT